MIAAALLAVAAASPAAENCLVDHARYVLRDDPSVTLRFHIVPKTQDWTSRLAVQLRLGATGRESWWLPTMNGSSDLRYFRWTALRGGPQAAPDYPYKLRDLQYFAFDAGYGMINKAARAGDPAPAHIFLTDLRDTFYYFDDPSTRTSPPQSLFDLVACDGPDDTPDVMFPSVP